ncbi:MAG: hypothetical protein K0R46_1626 [Herbinix sp.]|jgi:hypothetical protein|nr:hypothetical protein [Herbinix sp.]
MSAFLGPIHYWLYNKISLQQAIVDDLCQLGNQYGLALKAEADNLYGEFANKPLEEMIDQGNIHGWLQERVSQVEYKYAYVVTKLVNTIPDSLHTLKSTLYRAGNDQAQALHQSATKPTAGEMFKLITDQLLDGMPCDHANRLFPQNDTDATWTRNLCVHTPYWTELDGDINLYYELREAWLMGFLKEYDYNFEKVDDTTYRIYTLS